jgi:hypothetical protein
MEAGRQAAALNMDIGHSMVFVPDLVKRKPLDSSSGAS